MEDINLSQVIDNLLLDEISHHNEEEVSYLLNGTQNWDMSSSQISLPSNQQHFLQAEEGSFNLNSYLANDVDDSFLIEEDDTESTIPNTQQSILTRETTPTEMMSVSNEGTDDDMDEDYVQQSSEKSDDEPINHTKIDNRIKVKKSAKSKETRVNNEESYVKTLQEEYSNPDDLFNAPSFTKRTKSNNELDVNLLNLPKRMRYPLDSSSITNYKELENFQVVMRNSFGYKRKKKYLKFNNILMGTKKYCDKFSLLEKDEEIFKCPDSNTLEYLLETSEEYFDKTNANEGAYERNSCYDLMTLGVLMEEYADYLMKSSKN